MSKGTILFNSKVEGGFTFFYQTKLRHWLVIFFSLGFIAFSIIYKEKNYLTAWIIIFSLDILLEVAIIHFFKKDIIRKGKQVFESGSLWNGTKMYKGEIDYLIYHHKKS